MSQNGLFTFLYSQIITCMVDPLTAHLDEWKKALAQIEKEHSREAKRARGDLKRALSEANRLKKKLAKSNPGGTLHRRQGSYGGSTIGRGVGLGEPPTSVSIGSSGVGTSSLAVRAEDAQRTLETTVSRVEEVERSSLRRLMLEERARYCFFFGCLKPVLVS